MKNNQAHILIIHKQSWPGYVTWYIMESNGHAMLRIMKDDGKFDFEITDLFVEPDYRQQGLGEYILTYAIDFCKRQACHGSIIVQTHSKYAGIFVDDWYKRIGFKYDHDEIMLNFDYDEDDKYRVYSMVF